MCYSVEASFTTAAVLLPAGLICLKRAVEINRSYWAFAILPFLFGLQQFMEGVVWMTVEPGTSPWLWPSTFSYLFFSHFFWLFWIPLSSLLIETKPLQRKLFIIFTLIGVLFGGSIYIPLLTQPDWIAVSVQQHSIYYDARLIYDAILPRYATTVIYAFIILVPLLLSSDRYHKILGVLVMVAGLLSLVFFGLVFISVWCYSAAIISLYIYYQVGYARRQVPAV